jgi:hypothetical protein
MATEKQFEDFIKNIKKGMKKTKQSRLSVADICTKNQQEFLEIEAIAWLRQQFHKIEQADTAREMRKLLEHVNSNLCAVWHFIQTQKTNVQSIYPALEQQQTEVQIWDNSATEIAAIFKEYFTKHPAFYLDVMFAVDSVKSPLRNSGLKTIFNQIKKELSAGDIENIINALHENLIKHTQLSADKPVYSIAFSSLDKKSQQNWIITSVRACLTFFGSHKDPDVKATVIAFKNSWVAYMHSSNCHDLGEPDEAISQLPLYTEGWSDYSHFEQAIQATPIPGVMGADGSQDVARALGEVFQQADPELNGEYPGSPEIIEIANKKFEDIQQEYHVINAQLQELTASLNVENPELSLKQITLTLSPDNREIFSEIQQQKYQSIQNLINVLLPKMKQYDKALSKQISLLGQWQAAIITKRDELARELGQIANLYFKAHLLPNLQADITRRLELLNAHQKTILDRLSDITESFQSKYRSVKSFIAELNQEQRADVSSVSEALELEKTKLHSNAEVLQQLKQEIMAQEAAIKAAADGEYSTLPAAPAEVATLQELLLSIKTTLFLVKNKVEALDAVVDFTDQERRTRNAEVTKLSELETYLNSYKRLIHKNIANLLQCQQQYEHKQQAMHELALQLQSTTAQSLDTLTKSELTQYQQNLAQGLQQLQAEDGMLHELQEQYATQKLAVEALLTTENIGLYKQLITVLPIDNASLSEKIGQLNDKLVDINIKLDADYNRVKAAYESQYKMLEKIRIFRKLITDKYDEALQDIEKKYKPKQIAINGFAQELAASIMALQNRVKNSKLKVLPEDAGPRKALQDNLVNVNASQTNYDFDNIASALLAEQNEFLKNLDAYAQSLATCLPPINSESGAFYSIDNHSQSTKLSNTDMENLEENVKTYERQLEVLKDFATFKAERKDFNTKTAQLKRAVTTNNNLISQLNAELIARHDNAVTSAKQWLTLNTILGLVVTAVFAWGGFIVGGPLGAAIGLGIGLGGMGSGAAIGRGIARLTSKSTGLISNKSVASNLSIDNEALAPAEIPSIVAETNCNAAIAVINSVEKPIVPQMALPHLVRTATLNALTNIQYLTNGEPEDDEALDAKKEHQHTPRFLHSMQLGLISRASSLVGLAKSIVGSRPSENSPPISPPKSTPGSRPASPPLGPLPANTLSCPDLSAWMNRQPPDSVTSSVGSPFSTFNASCHSQVLNGAYSEAVSLGLPQKVV